MASDYNTLKSARDNVQTVLEKKKVHFSIEVYEDITKVPASILPHGQLRYDRIDFESTHGQRPSYAEILFFLRVILPAANNPRVSQDAQFFWTDAIRKALTVDALNIDDLAESKLISKVTTDNIEIINSDSGGVTALEYEVLIRYRESA